MSARENIDGVTNDYVERLRLAIDAIRYRFRISRQSEIGERLGFKSPSYLSDMLAGNKGMTSRFADAISSVFKINPEYLRTGSGDLWVDNFNGNNISGNVQIGEHLYHGNHNNTSYSNEVVKQLLDELAEQRKLTQKSQAQIDEMLKMMASLLEKTK
jgi:hypothetical protein